MWISRSLVSPDSAAVCLRWSGALLAAAILSSCAEAVSDQSSELRKQIQTTYTFRPSQLTEEVARTAKVSAMDKVWNLAEKQPVESAVVLREELDRPNANPWFRYDGTMLLARIDSSPDTLRRLAVAHATVDFADVDTRSWVERVAQLAVKDLDVTSAAVRWLSGEEKSYSLPEHGGRIIDRGYGALILFGSMEEARAFAVLRKIAIDPEHPERDLARSLIYRQETEESNAFLDGLNLEGLSTGARQTLETRKRDLPLIPPREGPPKFSRDEFLSAIKAGATDDWSEFGKLLEKADDGERDAITVLTPADVPAVRLARRHLAASANPHLLKLYEDFTGIIRTLNRQNK